MASFNNSATLQQLQLLYSLTTQHTSAESDSILLCHTEHFYTFCSIRFLLVILQLSRFTCLTLGGLNLTLKSLTL